MLRVPTDSILVGKTLAESRIGASTGLIILSLIRSGRSETLPSRQTVLRGGDGILVQGRVDQFRELRRWSDLVIEREAPVLKSMVAAKVAYAAVTIAKARRSFPSSFVTPHSEPGSTLPSSAYAPRRISPHQPRLRADYVRATRSSCRAKSMRSHSWRSSRTLASVDVSPRKLAEQYHADERMFVVRLPKNSGLVDETLAKSRLADVFDFRVLAVFRDGELKVMPRGDEVLLGRRPAAHRRTAQRPRRTARTAGTRDRYQGAGNRDAFESERLTLMDATLDPRSSLAGAPSAN